jgi:hypothetical protein
MQQSPIGIERGGTFLSIQHAGDRVSIALHRPGHTQPAQILISSGEAGRIAAWLTEHKLAVDAPST